MAEVASLSVSPGFVSALTGAPLELSAVVRNEADQPVVGVEVQFSVSGVNPATRFASTDTGGVARVVFISAVPGLDLVPPPSPCCGNPPSSAGIAGLVLPGTVTDDGLPSNLLTAHWSVVLGPSPVSFSPPNLAHTEALFTQPGTYVLRLTGDDGALQGTDETVITVLQNQLPGGRGRSG